MAASVSISPAFEAAVYLVFIFVLAECQISKEVTHARDLKTIESCPITFSGANWSDEDINTSPILGLGSASSCCSYCNQSYGERVKAYVYRTDQDSCHCKDQVNKPSFCPTCLGHNYNERKPPQSCNYRYNYEIFGFDLPGMPIEGITQPGECCKRCQQHGSGCVAWLWRRDFNRCYLKKTVVPLICCPQCVYGER